MLLKHYRSRSWNQPKKRTLQLKERFWNEARVLHALVWMVSLPHLVQKRPEQARRDRKVQEQCNIRMHPRERQMQVQKMRVERLEVARWDELLSRMQAKNRKKIKKDEFDPLKSRNILPQMIQVSMAC